MHYKFARKNNWMSATMMAGGICLALAAKTFADDLVPLQIKLPSPAFLGTPTDAPSAPDVEKPTGKPRPPIMVPPGVSNLAVGKTVTTSAPNTMAEKLAKIVDGDKDANESDIVQLRKGPQWVQIDLGSPAQLYAIVIWHAHDNPKVYHGVAVQVADDAGFTKNVRTLFNNDKANENKLGAGTNREYFESNEGKLVEAKGVVAQFVRCYSNGSTESRMNEYTEIEVYGRSAK